MLHIKDITYRLGNRLLFEKATTVVPQGKKIGLFGRNGTGKTTLLNLIKGELELEAGSINRKPKSTIGSIAQEAPDGPQSLIETVLESNLELTSLLKQSETETDPHKISEIHTRLGDIDAYTANSRAASLLAGLGFGPKEQIRPCSSFSGGWRMRVALACSLFNQPDLLLLDEPTNYLDLEGVIWLENFLKSYPYTILLVSHDRDLLNSCVDSILHLKDGKLNLYSGGYDQFEEARRLQQELISSHRTKQEAQRKHLQSFIDRFKAKASKAKQAQSRVKALERMSPIASASTDQTVTFNFPNPGPLSPPLLTLDNVSVGYEPGNPILSGLDIYIDMDDRIALLGQNGNGKSTFAKLLSNKLKLDSGQLSKSRVLKIGYFAQHQLDELHSGQTPFDHMQELMPDILPSKVRAQLGAFGFSADKADRDVATLSGGEKARLLFSLMSRNAPHLMILDEPTNHLDVDSREALIQALNAYDGAIILITHDRHLIEATAERLWVVEGGGVNTFDGDLDEYRQILLRNRGAKSRKERSKEPRKSKKETRKESALERQRIQPFKKLAENNEKKIERLNTMLDQVATELKNSKLYEESSPKNSEEVIRLKLKQTTLLENVKKAEGNWLKSLETYEVEKKRSKNYNS
ncbi:MAG: ABC-F family ATP-binding cassette domain-containing protein [Sphingomonadales bacterium]